MDENSSSTAQCFIQESGRILCLRSQLSSVTLRRRGGARKHDVLCRCTRVVRRKNQSSSRSQFSLQWQVRIEGSSPFSRCQTFFFFPFWVWFFGRELSFLALDLWRTFWLSTVSVLCSSSFSELDPCSWYEVTVSLVDTNENKGEIWEVKHALLLFVRIRVRVRVSLIWAFKLQKRNTKQAGNAGSSTLFSGIVLWFSKLACGVRCVPWICTAARSHLTSTGNSMLYSFLLFIITLSLQQVYREKLASTELYTILGGLISSILFLLVVTVKELSQIFCYCYVDIPFEFSFLRREVESPKNRAEIWGE